ncbi:hypothetical protein GCM10027430_06390 [Lysobacter tyrosinilyticus]
MQQAEAALEARERLVVDDWQRLKTTWKEAWTPGRVIIAGVVAGFLVGRTHPLRVAARSGQWMQLVTMLSGLFAGGSAQAAAQAAEETAETVEDAAGTMAAPTATSQDVSSTVAES